MPASVFSVFRQRLQNLSAANRNIFLPRLVQRQMVDVYDFGHLNRQPAFALIESLLRHRPAPAAALLDSRMEATNALSEKLSRLQRQVRYVTEEKGTNDLYAGWPVVAGRFKNDTLVRAPLLFFPVSLEVRKNQWWLAPRSGMPAHFNQALLLAYAWHNQLPVPIELVEWTHEEPAPDALAFINQLYQLLGRHALEVNFNREMFEQRLLPFQSLRKTEWEEETKTGRLKLMPQAVLGIFPQSSSTLAPDYEALEAENPAGGLSDFFSRQLAHPVRNSRVREEEIYAPFRLDAWQEQALLKIKTGQSLVVKGPPGTGKSQLIANLICDAMANNKRVLAISQKRVALEVVYNRLKEKKLSDFVGIVHDHQNDRQTIYAQLAGQISRVDEYKKISISLDAIQLERSFVQTARRIDQISEMLEEYRTALFAVSACGLSAKELYLQADTEKPALPLRGIATAFSHEAITLLLPRIRRWKTLADRLDNPQHTWFNRVSMASYHEVQLPEFENTVQALRRAAENLASQSVTMLGEKLDWQQAVNWQEQCEAFADLGNRAWQGEVYAAFRAMSSGAESEISELWLLNEERIMMGCFDDQGMEETLASDELGALHVALEHANRARKNIFRLMRWELFGKNRVLLKRVLIANGLPATKQGLFLLERRVDNRLNFEHHHTKLRQKRWLLPTPATRQRSAWQNWFSTHLGAIRVYQLWNNIRGLRHWLHPQRLEANRFSGRAQWLFHLLRQQQQVLQHGRKLLADYQINQIIHTPGYAERLMNELRADGEAMAELDGLNEAWTPPERELLLRCREHPRPWPEQAAAILNGWALAWIEHLETQQPALKYPAVGRLEELGEELRELVAQKQALAAEIVLLRARERTLDDLAVNRLNNRVTYRDLNHQVTKRRKIWPVRKTIAGFEHELFRLMPVWLTSPEAASALFPLRPVFDLVIFDEASQCFPEQAIPALCRAKQAVVAGDEQQLRPHDWYAIKWSDAETDEPDQEVESWLDLALRHLPCTLLQGHYRSRSAELIAFSNHHFYNKKLEVVPVAEPAPAPAIQVVRVNGIWENQTNRAEAEEVVRLVLDLAKTAPEKTVGIITFNAPQQDMVEDMIDKHRQAGSPLPGSLLVKNIENVQGDERDIILFSIGYAPDADGRMTAHFGSLNTAGGENRLNVAITRAREQMRIITSIDPEALPVNHVRNPGPRLLRDYLRFVLTGEVAGTAPAPSTPTLPPALTRLAQHLPVSPSGCAFAAAQIDQTGKTPMLLLADETVYQQHPAAKSWHSYVPVHLAGRGWSFQYVHSRQIALHREKVTALLRQNLPQ
jgi:hypothetical protein